MMNDDQTAWAYVRHDGTLRDHSASPSSTWWKTCDGHISQVSEADVLSDPNVVHFLIYTRQEGDKKESRSRDEAEDMLGEIADEGQEGGSKPNKNIRLDSVLDWWEKTALVVSTNFRCSRCFFLVLISSIP